MDPIVLLFIFCYPHTPSTMSPPGIKDNRTILYNLLVKEPLVKLQKDVLRVQKKTLITVSFQDWIYPLKLLSR